MEVKDLITERNELLRLMPVAHADRKNTRVLRLVIDDVLENLENPAAEHDIILLYIAKYNHELKAIFRHYAGGYEHKSNISTNRDVKTMSEGEMMRLIKDCPFLDEYTTIPDIDIILHKTNGIVRDSHHQAKADNVLYYGEFCEVLIRIAQRKFPDHPHPAERFSALLENILLPHAKRSHSVPHHHDQHHHG